jgi:hypothetical protein
MLTLLLSELNRLRKLAIADEGASALSGDVC